MEPIDRMIDAVTNDPARLPLQAMTDIHNSGHDVRIDTSGDRVIAKIDRRRDGRVAGLTKRELEVATLIASGFTNRQIAVALEISLGTVKDHVHSILAKTGFETRSQLIAAWYGGLENFDPA